MANYLTTDTDLTSVADAIRTKGGTSASLAFPADFVSAIAAIPSGGGDSDSGSFVATSASPISLTLTTTKKRSRLVIWADSIDATTDISGKPYPGNNVVGICVLNDVGFYLAILISSLQTSFSFSGNKIASWPNATGTGNNSIKFDNDSIIINRIQFGGSSRPLIDGHTYNWEAW